MYLYGAGGHAKVVLEILERQQVEVQGFLVDDPLFDELWGYPVTGYPGPFRSGKDELIISIGDNAARKKIAKTVPVKYGKAIHPFTGVSQRASIGKGSVVMAGVIINADAHIGHHCIINTNASVDHDCKVSGYVHISPNAALCGNVFVAEGTHIGAGAVIIPGIRIGKWCVIGAGAVVVNDIPDYATVVGNPGKVIKVNHI